MVWIVGIVAVLLALADARRAADDGLPPVRSFVSALLSVLPWVILGILVCDLLA